ncbi:hypothetical protein A3F66_05575 [candidate division TM6 bacterium RIFCSPHIGHO2_12_FULL_32_22]|nr:MAG: hypothetical protein A3F66_05575 [candidate division TM6 bacterium RIFCSPHIGHO2_12_FULL_32_22]
MEYFYVYILQCADGSFYTGHTDNLEMRIAQHSEGKIDGYTSQRLPIKCVFSERFSTRDEAFAAERKIKGWCRRKKMLLINGKIESLSARILRQAQDER